MRLLPDADLLVLHILREAVPGPTYGTRLPDELDGHLPFVEVRRIPGSSPVHPRFASRATMAIQVWAQDRKQAADLAEEIRYALYLAYWNQAVTPYGHIAWYEEAASPGEVPDGARPGIFRFQATYSLTLRPAP